MQASTLSEIQSQSWSSSKVNVIFHPSFDKNEDNKLEIELSQISQIQLLFKSVWSKFDTKGQLSREQTQNCFFNKSGLRLFSPKEQSLFSYKKIPTKFFIPSPSISSSQISGILSQSKSHLYFERVPFFTAFSHISTEFTWSVHWLTNAIHLFTSTELVNSLSQAVEYVKSNIVLDKSGLYKNVFCHTW